MDKRSFFIEAMQAGAYKHKDWIISAFTVCEGNDDDPKPITGDSTQYINSGSKSPDYPYRILRLKEKKGYCFVDPVEDELIEIVDSDKTKPLFNLKDKLTLRKGDLLNVKTDVETIYGNALVNSMIFIYPFGDKVQFMTGRLTSSKLDKFISERLHDTPEEGEERDDSKLYVDEYLKYCEAVSSLSGLALIGVPAGSPKLLTINPKIRQRRDELYEKHKDELHDPAVVAKIEDELVQMDIDDFKGDPSEGFLIKRKSFAVSRKRSKTSYGIEPGFETTNSGSKPIQKSLSEKWEIENLPPMVNSLRAASFNRGHQTALGGESVKFFYRVFQNTRILEDDCGVTDGMLWDITEDNYKSFVGLHRAFGNNVRQTAETSKSLSTEPMTEEFLKGMIGKKLKIRTPMLCKTKAPSFCARCVGVQIASSPTSVHISMSDVGSIFMLCFMKAMHGKALTTAFYDYNSAIT